MMSFQSYYTWKNNQIFEFEFNILIIQMILEL